jgi:type II secretory pathway component PulF
MVVFRYEAVDRAGKVVRGAMSAANEQAVAQRLTSMGYSLKAIVPAAGRVQSKPDPGGPRAALSPAAPGAFPVSVEPVVSLATLARFYRQLATLVRAGIPIFQALDDISSTTSNRKLQRACADIKTRVQAGERLSTGLAAYPLLFPVHSVGLIWGGELGGYLDVALDEAATEIEEEAKNNRQSSIGWFVAKLQFFFLILCLPVFDFGGLITLSLTTEAGSSAALQAMAAKYWTGFVRLSLPAFALWVIGAFVWRRLKRSQPVRRSLDAILLALPAWGGLHRERARQRFLKTLFRQYQAGVAPAQAWAAASMSVRNSELASRLRGIESAVRTPGMTLQQALAQSQVFAQEDAGMIGSGERAGSVPEMLERLSAYHADAAASARAKGRLVAWHALILWIIIPTGALAIAMASGFRTFFDIALKWAFGQ